MVTEMEVVNCVSVAPTLFNGRVGGLGFLKSSHFFVKLVTPVYKGSLCSPKVQFLDALASLRPILESECFLDRFNWTLLLFHNALTVLIRQRQTKSTLSTLSTLPTLVPSSM